MRTFHFKEASQYPSQSRAWSNPANSISQAGRQRSWSVRRTLLSTRNIYPQFPCPYNLLSTGSHQPQVTGLCVTVVDVAVPTIAHCLRSFVAFAEIDIKIKPGTLFISTSLYSATPPQLAQPLFDQRAIRLTIRMRRNIQYDVVICRALG